jgi:hypothetical protein
MNLTDALNNYVNTSLNSEFSKLLKKVNFRGEWQLCQIDLNVKKKKIGLEKNSENGVNTCRKMRYRKEH